MKTTLNILLFIALAGLFNFPIIDNVWGDCGWTGCMGSVANCWVYHPYMMNRGSEGCEGRRLVNTYCCATGNQTDIRPASRDLRAFPKPFVSFETFSRAVTDNGYPKPTQDVFRNFMYYSQKLTIYVPTRLQTIQEAAMALAQFLYQSGGFQHTADPACKDTGCPGKYSTPGCDVPGQHYYGRGYLMMTGCYNYWNASEYVHAGADISQQPDLVATNDDVAWRTAFWFWTARVRYGLVELGQFGASTKIISPEDCETSNSTGAMARFRIYGKIRRVFGLSGDGDPSGCTPSIPTTTSKISTTESPEEPRSLGNITFEQFSSAVTSNGYPSPAENLFHNFMRYAYGLGKISTAEEGAMALAQFLHESGGFRYLRELACKKTNCPEKYRTPKCDAPKQYYYGRGYIQLTWCNNYKEASLKIFGDTRLVTEPELVASKNSIAWQTSFWFWGRYVHNAKGVQDGKFGASTRAINSGECKSPFNWKAKRRFQIYGNVRQAFGLHGPGDSSGCA